MEGEPRIDLRINGIDGGDGAVTIGSGEIFVMRAMRVGRWRRRVMRGCEKLQPHRDGVILHGVMSLAARSLWVGSESGYEWLVAKCSLGDLLSLCPEIVMGKFVAVTAFDSGPLVPTEAERANGWNSQYGIAYSPRISDVDAVPYDNCYDEWYVFDAPIDIGRIAEQGSNVFETWPSEDTIFQFVNYHLGLHLESQEPLADLFWMQIRRIKPDVYLADCDNWVTMVSKNKELFANVRKSIQRSPTSG